MAIFKVPSAANTSQRAVKMEQPKESTEIQSTPINKSTSVPRNLLYELNEVSTSTRRPSPTRMLMRRLSANSDKSHSISGTPKFTPKSATPWPSPPPPPPIAMATPIVASKPPSGFLSEIRRFTKILHSHIKPSIVMEHNQEWSLAAHSTASQVNDEVEAKIETDRIHTSHVDLLKDIAQCRAGTGESSSIIRPSQLNVKSAKPKILNFTIKSFASSFTKENELSPSDGELYSEIVTSTTTEAQDNEDAGEGEVDEFEVSSSIYDALAGPLDEQQDAQPTEEEFQAVDNLVCDADEQSICAVRETSSRDLFTIFEDDNLEEEVEQSPESEEAHDSVTPLMEPQTTPVREMDRLSLSTEPATTPSPTKAEKDFPVVEPVPINGTNLSVDPRLICSICDWNTNLEERYIVSLNGTLHNLPNLAEDCLRERWHEVIFLHKQYPDCTCQLCSIEQ